GSTRAWETLQAAKDGSFQHRSLFGGYACVTVSSPARRVLMLEAAGHAMVFVNGEPRTGDPYSHGYVHLPVELRPGDNHLLFHVGRGQLKLALRPPRADAQLDLADVTVPDLFL